MIWLHKKIPQKVTELFIHGIKLFQLFLINTHTLRSHTPYANYFMRILTEQEFQWIFNNHFVDIYFKGIKKMDSQCKKEPCLFNFFKSFFLFHLYFFATKKMKKKKKKFVPNNKYSKVIIPQWRKNYYRFI